MKCPKCDNEDVFVIYTEKNGIFKPHFSITSKFSGQTASEECLLFECKKCKYSWIEETLEARQLREIKEKYGAL